MKSVSLRITPASEEQKVIAELDSKTRGIAAQNAENYLLLQQAKACVREFVNEARQHAPGTAIQMKKDYVFSNLKLSVHLDVSRNQGILERITSLLRYK